MAKNNCSAGILLFLAAMGVLMLACDRSGAIVTDAEVADTDTAALLDQEATDALSEDAAEPVDIDTVLPDDTAAFDDILTDADMTENGDDAFELADEAFPDADQPDTAAADADVYPFERVPCIDPDPDVLNERLCDEAADPAAAPDKIFIHCKSESGCFSDPNAPLKNELVVMAWNIERGNDMDEQIALIKSGIMPMPDVMLLGEVDRGCVPRSQGRNVAREYAKAFQMDYVFGVEFTELPRPGGDVQQTCEHGNAVLSRYPLGNLRVKFHDSNLNDWYADESEPRLGGRVYVSADVKVGDKYLHAFTIHFDTNVTDYISSVGKQAKEVGEAGLALPFQVAIGGDTNAGPYITDLLLGTKNDPITQNLFNLGYIDAHRDLPLSKRPTRMKVEILDIIFLNGEFYKDSDLLTEEQVAGTSDHQPVWTTVILN